MEAEFRTILANDTTLAGLVSTRIFWNAIPQATVDPCVVMYKISRVADAHHGGPSGLDQTLVQVDIRALTIASAWLIRDAIVSKLHAKRITQDGIEFKGILLRNERQTSEKPDTTLYHRISLDFEMWTGIAG